MNTIKIDGNVIIGLAISAAAAVGIYKLAKIGIEADKKNEEARAAFNAEKEKLIKEKDYEIKIDLVSLRNDVLDADERRHAFLILHEELGNLRGTTSNEQLNLYAHKLDRTIDIFERKDPDEMHAIIDIYLAREEARELQKERDHELAVAKAAGNIELEKAKKAANAETSKAKLYSTSIDTAVKIGKEILSNERKQESNN